LAQKISPAINMSGQYYRKFILYSGARIVNQELGKVMRQDMTWVWMSLDDGLAHTPRVIEDCIAKSVMSIKALRL
jgi:hypothetical protein